MRPFVLACLVSACIAFGSAAILVEFVQQSATSAFAELSARV